MTLRERLVGLRRALDLGGRIVAEHLADLEEIEALLPRGGDEGPRSRMRRAARRLRVAKGWIDNAREWLDGAAGLLG